MVVDVWHNLIVKQMTRPREYLPLMGLLYGWPDAEEEWEKYLRDLDAWTKKWRKIKAKD